MALFLVSGPRNG